MAEGWLEMTVDTWSHVDLVTDDEVRAIKAMFAGEAAPGQQRLALQVIVNKFSRAQDMLFVPGSQDQTAFLNGRGFVGMQILKMIKVPIGKLQTVDEESK
jgi:hypothetical protein